MSVVGPPSKPPVALAPHANRAAARRFVLFGSVLATGGLAAGILLPGSLVAGSIVVAMGAMLGAVGLYARREGDSAQLINKANNLLAEGRLQEAEQLVAYGERTIRGRRMRRALAVMQAGIAMRLGDVSSAMARIDRALARPVTLFGRELDQAQFSAARALRAVLRASTGDRTGASADIELVRTSAQAFPESLARAALAEAILLERAGERDKLRDLLVRERPLLLGHTRPRERAIVRAYQRMLKAAATTVYRTGASRDPAPSHAEPTLADWVAKIAPSAASFVRAAPPPKGSAPDAPPPPVDGAEATAARKAARARLEKVSGSKQTRLFALWVVLISLLLVSVWQLLSSESAAELPEPEIFQPWVVAASTLTGAVILALAGLLVAIAVSTRNTRNRARKFIAGLNAVARADETGVATLEEASRDRNQIISAAAWLQLAALAEKRGRLADALAHCDKGLGALSTEALRVQSADLLLPELLCERAFVLLASGRRDEGAAELALVAESFQSFPFMARARFRFTLLDHVKRGDLAGALSVAREADELALSIRDELLADLVRAVASPETLGAEEAERLREELRLDVEARDWLAILAKDVLDGFLRGPEADPRDAEAELEAAAEAEVLGALSAEPARRL